MILKESTGTRVTGYQFPHDPEACPDEFLRKVEELDFYGLGAEAAAELEYRAGAR